MGAFMNKPELYPLPGLYHRDRAHLMPVNPEQLFVVWEITSETLNVLRGLHSSYNWEQRHIAFRLFYPMVRSYSLVDINLYNDHGSWFIDCPVQGEQVECEIGYWLPFGVWVPVIVSNKITTPRGRPHWGTAVRWMSVRYIPPVQQNLRHQAFNIQAVDPLTLNLQSKHYLESIESQDDYQQYLEQLRSRLNVDEYLNRMNSSSGNSCHSGEL